MTDKEELSGELSLRLKNYSRVLVLASGGFLFGFYLGAMNALGVPIIQGVLGYDQKKEKDKHNTIYGMTNFLFGVGSLIGNVSGGKIANAFGRRAAFYTEIGLMALAIAPSLIVHTSAYLISRFLIGVSVGINLCIYNVILAELLPNKLCGIGGDLRVFFLTLGLLLSSLCQNIWEYSVLVKHWRWFVIYPMAVELMRVVAFPFVFITETLGFIFNKIFKSSSEN